MRVAVIGGAGFIGRYVTAALLALGCRVTVVGRRPRDGLSLPPEVDYIASDYGIAGALDQVLASSDAVIDLAYASTPQTSFADPMADLLGNVPPAVTMFESARARRWNGRILVVSSGGTVYGWADKMPLAEEAPTLPISPYGITKLATERYAHLYRALHGLDTIVVRPGNAFGTGQRPFTGQGFIATAMGSVVNGRRLTIFGPRGTVRDYVHAVDVAGGIVAVLERGRSGETYNVGTGIGRDNLDVLQALVPLAQAAGMMIDVDHQPARSFDVPVNILDCGKIARDCGWHPAIDFGAGLAEMWTSFRDRRPEGLA